MTVFLSCFRSFLLQPECGLEQRRLLSSESTVTDLGEYFTNQFLSLSCYGARLELAS